MFKSLILLATSASVLSAESLTFEGTEGPGKGKHIVFLANDHEYRSEQSCPAVAKILAKHHGFKCTVLFGLNEKGEIKPGAGSVPGLEVLKEADLLFLFARFMNLPDEQVDPLVAYFERGGPVIGLRTSTHAFHKQAGKWAKLNYNYEGKDYLGGLGEQVLGNTWHKKRGQSHYGGNHREASRIIPTSGVKHPVLTGVSQIHALSGAYASVLPDAATSLLEVQVLKGFTADSEIREDLPLATCAWARDSYVAPSGKKKDSRVVYASYGASEDVLDANTRRFFVNSCFWAVGLESEIKPDLEVSIVGGFKPSPYSTGRLYNKGVKPADLAAWESQVMPEGTPLAGLNGAPKTVSARVRGIVKNRPELKAELMEKYPELDFSAAKPKKK